MVETKISKSYLYNYKTTEEKKYNSIYMETEPCEMKEPPENFKKKAF